MLRWVTLAALLVLSSAGTVRAQSLCDGPFHWGPCKGGEATPSNQQPGPDERGSASRPVIVEIAPTQEEKDKGARAAKEEHEKAEREWHLVIGTYAIALSTFLLMCGTIGLAAYTFRLWRATKSASAEALVASTKATQTLVKIERAYLTGGGPVKPDEAGGRYFRVEVANYGKTPAFLSDFDVRFATMDQVKASPMPVSRRLPFDDRIAPGDEKVLGCIQIPPGTEVVYGAFWYKDWLKQDHIFRFILRIAEDGDTRTDVAGVDESYRHWD